MPEENATTAVVATPAAPVVNAPEKPGAPEWLPARLEQAAKAEQAKIAAELGVSIDEAKALIASAKAKAESEKAAEVRAAELAKQLSERSAAFDKATEAVKAQADAMLESLLPEHKAAVLAMSGADPFEQLRAIRVLGPTWKAAAVQSVEATTPAATTTAASAPPSGTQVVILVPKATYESLRATNPFMAAAYGNANPEAYR